MHSKQRVRGIAHRISSCSIASRSPRSLGARRRILSKGRSVLELWGGVECTINRVGDAYYDQLASSGHRERVREDLDLFAGLGLRTLRTAVHWEYSEKRKWSASNGVLKTMD